MAIAVRSLRLPATRRTAIRRPIGGTGTRAGQLQTLSQAYVIRSLDLVKRRDLGPSVAVAKLAFGDAGEIVILAHTNEPAWLARR